MWLSAPSKFALIVLLSLATEVIPIQLQEGEEIKENNVPVESSPLNQCLNVQRGAEVGVCFGKELLNQLNQYDETDSFSLATGVSFVRDDKSPRDFGNFLDKDPMDFRSMIEDASNLMSKRSLHWDLSGVYPGLVMRIAPTLANGVLEFIMDPRIKDRTYNTHHHQPHGEVSTGRLLARNLLVPFLLGFKFQLSTLLPLILGLVLIASKKAFFLSKLALLAVTVFSGSGSGGGFGGGFGNSWNNNWNEGSPSLQSYSSAYDTSHFHGHHGSGAGYYQHRHPHHDHFFKTSEAVTGAPITPDELRDRIERLFVTKKDNHSQEDGRRHDEDIRLDDTVQYNTDSLDNRRQNVRDEEVRRQTIRNDEVKVRNARNFAWTPLNTG